MIKKRRSKGFRLITSCDCYKDIQDIESSARRLNQQCKKVFNETLVQPHILQTMKSIVANGPAGEYFNP